MSSHGPRTTRRPLFDSHLTAFLCGMLATVVLMVVVAMIVLPKPGLDW